VSAACRAVEVAVTDDGAAVSALGSAVVRVQILDELGAGDPERDGPGACVAVGVAGVVEDVAERDAGGGHPCQDGDQGADGVVPAGRHRGAAGEFGDGRAVLAGAREDKVMVFPPGAGAKLFGGLAGPLPAEEIGDECRHSQGALAPFGLGVAVGPDGAPHGNVRRDGRVSCWVTVEVHVLPGERLGGALTRVDQMECSECSFAD
jgi:hypothetical protein